MNTPWSVKFEEYGGYDAMTSSYNILDCNGRKLFMIDVNDIDWILGSDRDSWEERHREHAQSRRIAEHIVKLVNANVIPDEQSNTSQEAISE